MSDPYGPPPPNPYQPQPQPQQPGPYQPGPYQPGYPPNPYGSPAGQAGDPDHRPLTLTLAVIGMWLGALLSAAGAAIGVAQPDRLRDAMQKAMDKQAAQQPTPTVDTDKMLDTLIPIILAIVVVSALISIGLWIWMAIANGRGIGWARIVATVFGGIGLASTFSSLVQGAASGLASSFTGSNIAVTALELVLTVVLLVLMWLPASSAYYNARGAAKRARQQAQRGY